MNLTDSQTEHRTKREQLPNKGRTRPERVANKRRTIPAQMPKIGLIPEENSGNCENNNHCETDHYDSASENCESRNCQKGLAPGSMIQNSRRTEAVRPIQPTKNITSKISHGSTKPPKVNVVAR